MKGTLFSADFVKDNSGNPRLLEINTDTTIIDSVIDDQADFTAFNSVLSSNNISEVHVVFKGFHKPLVAAISSSVAANVGSVTTWSETEEEHSTVYPTSISDAANKFILRLAYDENAILDSTYAKQDINLYKLFYDNNAKDDTVGVFHSSSICEINTLEDNLNEANIPDVVVRPMNAQKLALGWYKIGSSSLSNNERVMGFIPTVANTGNLITNYYRSGSADKVSAIRSFHIVYGDNLDILNIAQYEIDALLDIPADAITVDDSIFRNKVSAKHYFEYATNDISDDDGVFTEERINLEAGGSHLASAAVVGSEYDSYFVSGSPDTDSNVTLGQWSIGGPDLPAGSYSTSSILQGAVSQSIKSNSIRKITLNDGSILRVGGGNRILTLNTASNKISYLPARELLNGYEIFDRAGNKKSITGTEVEVLANESEAFTMQLSVEDVDNYIVSGSNLILHNAPCFIAGTKIDVEGGAIKNIEDIQVGEKVLTHNHETSENEYKAVEEILHKDEEQPVVHYHFKDDVRTLVGTYDHPIWIVGKGYASYRPELTKQDSGIDVELIEEGDKVLLSSGVELEISLIEEIDGNMQVFNLSKIADNNNFFANGLLVHNRWGIFGCFGKGSKVEMFDGTFKAIEEIKVGDEVKTKTGEKGIVKETLIHPVNDMVPVYKYNDAEVEGNHPICLHGRWMAAKDYIDNLEWKFVNNWYNLEIEGGEHTYIIEGLVASGLGDNKELNEKYQRQPKELINHL